MKSLYRIIPALLILLLASCGDDVEKNSNWPEWKMPSPMTVNGVVLDKEYYKGYQSATVHLEKGQDVEFAEVDYIGFMLPGDYFEMTGPLKAKFLGETSDYNLNYDSENGLLYIEKDAAIADGLWLCGTGWGHPKAGAVTTKGWTTDNPNSMIYCYQEEPGVYSATLYLTSTFQLKFYKSRSLDKGENEISMETGKGIAAKNAMLLTGNSAGAFCGGPMFKTCVATVHIDLNQGVAWITSADGTLDGAIFFINNQEMGVLGTVSTCLGLNLDLNNGEEVSFGNFENLSNILPKGWFEVTGDTTAKFTAPSGNYNLYYDPNSKLVYVENHELGYPDCLWFGGQDFGHPARKEVTAHPWSSELPSDLYQLYKVGDDLYECYVYLSSGFKFNLYKNHSCSKKITNKDLDPMPGNMLGRAWTKAYYGGYFTDEFAAAENFREGVYRIRVDMANGTCLFADHTTFTGKVVYKVNGVEMTQDTQKDFLSCIVPLTQGGEVVFEGFANVDKMLQPDYFKKDGANYKFMYKDQKYKIMYSPKRGLIYCKIEGNDWTDRYYPNCLWITGATIGHPMTCNEVTHSQASWGFDDPKDFIIAMPTAEGIYEATVWLGGGFMFRYYWGHTDWGHQFEATHVDTTPAMWCGWAGKDLKSENFGPGPDYEEGSYHLTLDVNRMMLTFTKLD